MEPNPVAILLLCFGGAAVLIFLLWLNHVVRTGGGRKSESASIEAPRPKMSYLGSALSYLLGGVGSVNDYEDSAANVMSRAQDRPSEIAPSSLQTDGRQTADRPMMPVPTAEEMLDIFRVLRTAGVKRDALQGVWRAAGLKLDNNLWSKAAPPPPEEPTTVTPIAGRSTSAQFHDPELNYQPPPR